MDIQKFVKSEVIMKHTKMTALLCTLALSGCISATAAPQAGSTPLDPYRAAVQKMKDLEKAEKKGEQSTPASAPAAAAPAGDVNYTDALLKGLNLTVSDVQASIESGTFKNLSPEAPKPVVEQPAAEPEPAEEPEPETEPEPVSPPVKKYTISQGEAANELSSDGNYENGVYTSDKADENALRVPMAYITAPNAQITKAGDSTDVDSSRLYGQNAAFLATHGGRAAMTGAHISSSGIGSTGAYGYSKSTYISLKDSSVVTTGNNSAGTAVSARAMMKVENSTVSTTGDSSPAIMIADGGGILIADGGSFTTSGAMSQGIYSKGDVTITNASVNALNAKAAVLKGNNTITLSGTILEGKETTDAVPYNIVLFSDEKDIGTMGTQHFDVRGGSLISHKGGMFYVTATHGKISLSGTAITMDAPAANLITVAGNDGANGWGTPGRNGGHVELVADNQVLTGNISVDSISNINMTLKNNSTFNGMISIVPNAEGGEKYKTNADVFIAAGSTWNLTGNSTLTSLYNLGTINYNGYTITLADGTVMKA
ncbi:MAG: hypothetical protein EP148_01385 [Dialister invisus]|jgi:hypothetical protein|nr:hypothetical protein [Dialister invisus]